MRYSESSECKIAFYVAIAEKIFLSTELYWNVVEQRWLFDLNGVNESKVAFFTLYEDKFRAKKPVFRSRIIPHGYVLYTTSHFFHGIKNSPSSSWNTLTQYRKSNKYLFVCRFIFADFSYSLRGFFIFRDCIDFSSLICLFLSNNVYTFLTLTRYFLTVEKKLLFSFYLYRLFVHKTASRHFFSLLIISSSNCALLFDSQLYFST